MSGRIHRRPGLRDFGGQGKALKSQKQGPGSSSYAEVPIGD